jgi:hypothetical protein
VATNIAAGSYLLHVSGARPVGISPRGGLMVLEVDAGGSEPPGTITVTSANSAPIVLGRVLTLAGLAILALELAFLPARRLLARRRRGSGAT